MAEKAECDGLCFDPELNLWQYSTLQSGAWKLKKTWEEKKKAEIVRRKWATWIITGYKKKLCVGWIWLCSRLICCQVPSAGGRRSLCGWQGLPVPTLLGFPGVIVPVRWTSFKFRAMAGDTSALHHHWPMGRWHPTLHQHYPLAQLQVSSHPDLNFFYSITSFLK